MARQGISQADVEKAVSQLESQNLPISIDAVRSALGNTGSKSTIHRHLKTLQANDTQTFEKPALSDELSMLVGHVAERIGVEAHAALIDAQADFASERETLNNKIDSLLTELSECEELIKEQQSANEELRSQTVEQHHTIDSLSQDKAQSKHERQALTEQIELLKSHNASLEQKHSDAREALAHYRESVSQQREHEQGQFDHQLALLQQQLRDSQLSVTQCQDEKLILATTCAKLEQTVILHEDKILALSTTNEQLTSDLEQSTPTCQKQTVMLTQLDGKKTELKITVEALIAEKTDWAQREHALTQKCMELQTTLDLQQQLLDKVEVTQRATST